MNVALDNFETANTTFEVDAGNVGSIGGESQISVSKEKICMGSTGKKSQCDFTFPDIFGPLPVLLDFTYKAIWDINIPNLPVSVAERMEDVASRLIEASVDCGKKSCNNNGYCVADESAWGNIQKEDVNDFSIFWDSDHCICFDNDVQLQRDCSVSPTPSPTPAPTPKPKYKCQQNYIGQFNGNCVAHPIDWYSTPCENFATNTPYYVSEYEKLPKVYDDIDWVKEGFFVAKYNSWEYCGGGGQYVCDSFNIMCEKI